MRRGVIDALEQRDELAVFEALEREGPLTDLRDERLGIETLSGDVRETQAVERSSSHDDRLDPIAPHSGDPRGDVPSQPHDHEVGTCRQQERPAPRRAGRDDRSLRQRCERTADQDVRWVATLGHRGEHEAFGSLPGQVLRRMDGHVGTTVEHGSLDLLGEHPPARERPEVDVAPAITFGLHHDDGGVDAGRSEQGADHPCLCEGKRGSPRGEPDRSDHSPNRARTASASR